MSQKEKLIKKFCLLPNDFTYDELRTMLKSLGYEEDTSGDGSRVKFYNKSLNSIINLHKPHPGNIVKKYLLKQIKQKLEEEELIWIKF